MSIFCDTRTIHRPSVRGLFAGYKSHLAHIKNMVVNLSSFGDKDSILAEICHKNKTQKYFSVSPF